LLIKFLKKIITNRLTLIIPALLLQLAVLIAVIIRFNEYFAFFYGFNILLSLVVVLVIINNNINPAYKIGWLIPILLFPIFGGLIYLIFGRDKLGKRAKNQMMFINDKINEVFLPSEELLDWVAQENKDAANQARYIQKYSFCPLYLNDSSEFLSTGEMKFQKLMEALRSAEHYIFLEYYIIEEGYMWNSILQILQEKAQAGVDVRVIYDDVGCLLKLPYGYNKQLEAMGIRCCVFNPLNPILSFKYNHRDHRKIAVIDGRIGFTGGINLADEYINELERFGHWKDAAIMLEGAPVWSLTVIFLSMWDYLRGEIDNFQGFNFNPPELALPEDPEDSLKNGFVQPFSDSPLDDEAVGETVYLNIINKTKDYVYITTPYLILSNEMIRALTAAAKSGIDVRIITPHHGDKWFVHMVTRSYYNLLMKSGVKIYEYTPGFIHAKTYVADDMYGVVGTINMDYRSLYLHFECGVWLYNCHCVADIKKDFLETLSVCQQITSDYFKHYKWYHTLISSILRVFAPLL
jgi:cardiolipin synthase